ncbi:MAG: ATP-dependent carboxylate-amine ligase domain protein ATP-grasp [Acidobacteriaceae bacterium]|nr:ATP-dependent carboxylate-amine ligase domain protein ATP-grasp [Acidobacteriaceae bacterium]
MPVSIAPTILCIATAARGHAFLLEARRRGLRPVLLTLDALRGSDWPREAIEEIISIERPSPPAEMLRTVHSAARRYRFGSVVGLAERDAESAAIVREDMRLPGMGQSTTRLFRDKLAMRHRAQEAHIPIPRFCALHNDEEIRGWVDDVRPPWLLKPRNSGGAVGIEIIRSKASLFDTLETLADRRPSYLLEQYLQGIVYHVDSVAWKGEAVFKAVSEYGISPLDIVKQGGIYSTRTLSPEAPCVSLLRSLDRRVLGSFGLQNGVSHSEFLLTSEGQAYFIESAARVGGGYISEMLEAAYGVNQWKEWAAIEASLIHRKSYMPPSQERTMASGVVLTNARNIEAFVPIDRPSSVCEWHLSKHQIGVIVSSESFDVRDALIDDYKSDLAKVARDGSIGSNDVMQPNASQK